MQQLAGLITEITVSTPKSFSILPQEGENLKDFVKRVYKHFIGNGTDGAFSYIDKTKNGYSSKLTGHYKFDDDSDNDSDVGFSAKYNKSNRYLVDYFSLPQWKDIVKVKIINGNTEDGNTVVRFLTKEHPRDVILKKKKTNENYTRTI